MSHLVETTRASMGKRDTIAILLADDHPLVRQALRAVLEKEDDFTIVAEAGDGEEAVKRAADMMPDVVIMDIGMPKLNGIEATRQIKAAHPEIKVLVLTVHGDEQFIIEALKAGAAGYLVKSILGDEAVKAIRTIIAGDMVLSPAIGCQLVRQASRHPTIPMQLDGGERLSPRELEIMKLAARGMSNSDIALELKLSLRTVKGHLAAIFAKLRVGSRTEAVIAGLRLGCLSLDDLN